MALPQIVSTFLEFQNQVKIYHWSTDKYARHVASDNLFNILGKNIDKFIETYQGSRNKKLKLSEKCIITLSHINDLDMLEYLKEFAKWLSNDLPKVLDQKHDTDLLNIRDEILSDVNNTIYLFSFN
jgi:hypothetical protein